MVVDVENLFMSVHKEEDTDTKQVYFYLFKVSFLRSRDGEALVRIGDLALRALLPLFLPMPLPYSSCGNASCR